MALNPPSGIVKWFNTTIGERGWNSFRSELTGKDYPGTSRKTSYVKLSDEEAEEVIKNIKKDSEGIPLFDEANAPDKREEYQRWLVARYLTKAREEGFESRKKEGVKELEEELGPEGLDELLGLIREEAKVAVAAGGGGGSSKSSSPPQSSSALAVVPKKPEDLVEEDIDSVILSILGLEEVFDLTYEEYASLLKEASVKGRMPGSQMSTESVELVTEEFKRVKNKTGRFKVKPKKVNIDKVFNRKTPSPSSAIVKPQKLIPSAAESLQEPEAKPAVDAENLQEDLLNGIGNILESLITIRTLLSSQSKTDQKAAQEDRKETEKKKKKQREDTLEKKKPVSPILKAITKPVDDFFGAIKNFFTNVLLGSVVLGLFRWLKDPKNQQAIDGFTNFLQNNAGLILGGLLAIASLPLIAPLLSLTGAITGIAIPALTAAFGFLASPAGLVALAGLAAGAAAATLQNVARPRLQQLVGGESVTKSGLKFRYEDIVSLRNKAYDFMVNAGAPPAEVNKQIKPYEDLMATMRFKKKLNDEMYEIEKKQKENQTRYKDPKTYENLTPLQEKQLRERLGEIQKDLNNQYRQKEKEKNIASEAIKAKFEKIGVGEAALEKAITARGGTVGRLGQPVTQASPPGSGSTFINPTPKTNLKTQKGGYAADTGLDIHGKIGDPIVSPVSGTLEYAEQGHTRQKDDSDPNTPGYQPQHSFRIKLDKPFTFKGKTVNFVYGTHLSSLDPSVANKSGIRINQGQLLGKMGQANRVPHLHLGLVGDRNQTEFLNFKEVDEVLGGRFGNGTSSSTSPAQVAPTSPPTPSIPSPTGRGNIVPLPIPTGGGVQQASSGTAPNQAPVPRFSSEDPNNTTTMVVRAIYNIVG